MLPNNPKGRFIVRVLAGGYLLYLAWSLRAEFTHLSPMTLAPILFAVVGVLFIVTGLRAMAEIDARQKSEEESAQEDSAQEENEEESEDGDALPGETEPIRSEGEDEE